MEVIKQKIEEVKKEKSAFRWKVPSVSNWGEYHHVSFGEYFGWECDCIAFKMSKVRVCKHILLVQMDVKGESLLLHR